MKHQNSKKRGFTLVELLVVIAILAILATVSIVGYTSFIKKANLSNDQVAITMMNRYLDASSVADQPETIQDVADILIAEGLNLTSMHPQSTGYSYAWESTSNTMVLIDSDGNICYPDGADTTDVQLLVSSLDESTVSGIPSSVTTLVLSSHVTVSSAVNLGDKTLILNNCVVNFGESGSITAAEVKNGYVAGDTQTDSDFSKITGTETNLQAMSVLAKADAGYVSASTIVSADDDNDSATLSLTNKSVDIKNTDTLLYATKNPDGSVSNYAQTSEAKTIVIENCVIDGDGSTKFTLSGYDEVTIKNCQIEVRLQIWGCKKVTIEDCRFDGARGISFDYCVSSEEIVIDGNYFSLSDNSQNKNFAIQFSDTEGKWTSIRSVVIKNNTFNNCNAVIRLHETFGTGQAYDTTTDCTSALKAITDMSCVKLSGNIYNTGCQSNWSLDDGASSGTYREAMRTELTRIAKLIQFDN